MRFRKAAEKMYSKLEEQEVNGKLQHFNKRRIYPSLNKDGTINWKNLLAGNLKDLLFTILILLIAAGLIWEYTTNLKIGAECLAREQARNLTNFLP